MNWWKSASQDGATLGMFIRAATNMEDADFWIVRRGSESAVGEPVREFSKEHIGVKVLRTNLLLPEYARWLVHYGWMRGWFRSRAVGTTRLVNIKVRDVEEMPLPKRAASETQMKVAVGGEDKRVLEHTTFYGIECQIDWAKTGHWPLSRTVGNRWEADVDIEWLRTDQWPFWIMSKADVKSMRRGDGSEEQLDDELRDLIAEAVRSVRSHPLVGAWRDQEEYSRSLDRHREKVFFSKSNCSQSLIKQRLWVSLSKISEDIDGEDLDITVHGLIHAAEFAQHRMKIRNPCELLTKIVMILPQKPYLLPQIMYASENPESDMSLKIFSSLATTDWNET